MASNRLRVLVFMAWRNLWRNPVRSALTLSAFAFGLAMMILYGALIEGVNRQMVRYATEVSLGELEIHRQRFIDDQDQYALLPDDLAARIGAEVPGVRATPRLLAAALASAGPYSTGVLLKGLDPERETGVTTLHKHLRAGEFRFGAEPAPPAGAEYPGVVVGLYLARALKLEIGAELILVSQAMDGSIGNALYRVSGILNPVDPALDRMGVLMALEDFRELMALPAGVHEIVITTGDPATLGATQEAIAAALEGWGAADAPEKEGGRTVVRRWDQIVPAIADMLALQDAAAWIVSLIFLGLAGLGMLNTMLMSVFERTRELAILLALGMGRGWLTAMVLLESLFLALVSALIGTIAGVAYALRLEREGWDFSSYLPEGFDFQGVVMEPVYRGYLTAETVWFSVAVMMAIAMLAAAVPSWRVARLRPAAAMQ